MAEVVETLPMKSEQAFAPPAHSSRSSLAPVAVATVIEDLNLIREFISHELKDGIDYGKVAGCGDKPALLQPGAQKTCMFMNVYPEYDVQRNLVADSSHVEYIISTRLLSRSTGGIMGTGIGSCSTLEKKYRYRRQEKACPKCGAAAIRSKKAGGFFCAVDKGGCGAGFAAGDKSITDQRSGMTDNPDIADTFNTVLKMAKKRSFVDATLTLSCISDFFTQDIDEQGALQPAGKPVEKPDTHHHAAPAMEEPEPEIDWASDRAKRLAVVNMKAIEKGVDQVRLDAIWLDCGGSDPREMEQDVFGACLANHIAEIKATLDAAANPPAEPTVEGPHPQVTEYQELFNHLLQCSINAGVTQEQATVTIRHEWEAACKKVGAEDIFPAKIPSDQFMAAMQLWQATTSAGLPTA